MNPNKYPNAFWLIFIIISVLLLTWSPIPAEAGSTLPPRATPAPSSESSDTDGGKEVQPPGAYIELKLQDAPIDAWTVVQWQDSAGGWQNVEGWQGTPDMDGKKRWWVRSADFGKGPFRWAVYQEPDSPQLATSGSLGT